MVRISLSARARSDCASASRFRRLSSLRWMLALSSMYPARGAGSLGPEAGPDGSVERGATVVPTEVMVVYQIDARRWSRDALALAACGDSAAGSRIFRVNTSNCEAMSELPVSASGTPELSAVETVL